MLVSHIEHLEVNLINRTNVGTCSMRARTSIATIIICHEKEDFNNNTQYYSPLLRVIFAKKKKNLVKFFRSSQEHLKEN